MSEYTFREKESHDLLDETIVIIIAELASFRKSEEEHEIIGACEIGNFDKDKRLKYDSDMIEKCRWSVESHRLQINIIKLTY